MFKPEDIIELEQIQKVKDLFEKNGLAILNAFNNGQHIVIETMTVGTGEYNPGILIPTEKFCEHSGLTIDRGYTFSIDQKKWLENYIVVVGKFNIENRKPDSILKTLFDSFNSFSCQK